MIPKSFLASYVIVCDDCMSEYVVSGQYVCQYVMSRVTMSCHRRYRYGLEWSGMGHGISELENFSCQQIVNNTLSHITSAFEHVFLEKVRHMQSVT